MLRNTFIHVPGIGPLTERRLWAARIAGWEECLRERDGLPLSPARAVRLVDFIRESQRRLAARDYRFFARALPSREAWRAYPEFRHSCAFVDIETTGLDVEQDITVVGIYDGRKVRSYVKGYDLEEAGDMLQGYSLLVTYNGARFDLPFLRHAFPGLRLDQVHVDLMYCMWRLGYRGGLKAVEEALGVGRSQETHGLDGFDAVRLWHEYEAGSRQALDLLVRYNAEDITNLKPLMEFAYTELRKQAFGRLPMEQVGGPGGHRPRPRRR